MEDIRAIYRIFNNLKYEMENNGWVYQWHLGDEPIKVTFLRRGRQFFSQLYHLFFKKSAQRKGILE